jgi:hypothetical protein
MAILWESSRLKRMQTTTIQRNLARVISYLMVDAEPTLIIQNSPLGVRSAIGQNGD